MTNLPLRAIAIFSSSLVIGCAWTPWGSSSAPQQSDDSKTAKITPYARIQDGADSADAFHALGRHLQREGRLDDAERAYRRALDFDPGHQETRNALAVLYASRGDLRQAIALLSALVATRPDQPHLLANLGYAHYLNGEYAAAKERLQQALALAPDNEATRRKMALVMEKLGEPVNATEDIQQALALPVPVPPPDTEASAQQSVTRVSEGVYALTRQLPVSGAKPAAAQCEITPSPNMVKSAQASTVLVTAPDNAAPRLRLELANGNGVNRLARSVRDLIAGSQWQVVRVINHEEFTVPVTRIEYARHRYEAAREFAQTLGVAAQLRPNYQQGDTHLRVVFGRDFRSTDSLREHLAETEMPALVSLN